MFWKKKIDKRFLNLDAGTNNQSYVDLKKVHCIQLKNDKVTFHFDNGENYLDFFSDSNEKALENYEYIKSMITWD
jgi:hypothetical protein